jgi:transcriptional regulator GlxA family with amidase domain
MSGLDLAPALIESDSDSDFALEVARQLVTYMPRRDDSAQVSMFVHRPREW